jgi:SAM-dependent methyltransferase
VILPLAIFRALADPTRLRIVALMRTMELAVGEVAQVLGQSQPRVSRHIRILCEAGIARRRKEGSWVFLDPGAPEIVQPVFRAIDQWQAEQPVDPWTVADAARLSAVRADRAAAAARYFAAHAEEWDSLRSLYVSEDQVEAAVVTALEDRDIGRLVDVGTGTGRMIELLGPKARGSIGIDRSPEMLRLARAKLSQLQSFDWELRQGDLGSLPLDDASADTVIVHQVLHFLPEPAAAMIELGRIIGEGGRLLVADFAPHNREELRDRDAHARLGFSDDQIAGWMDAAGIALAETENLKGGTLTVKLWLGEKRATPRLKAVAA